uniref:Docking protein 7 n=1 Tax=Gopherus evgoodei TaxID=1825980 RepID=A0A8C4VNH9_9SAUR
MIEAWARGTTKPPPKPLRSRQLQEIGRQSSSDSGIATGSHSSYSGSFSSYAGSLDICHGDEFGSLLSLPLNLPSDQNLCTCLHSEPQRSLGSEYQIPSPVRHIYDTPRSISDPKVLVPHSETRMARDSELAPPSGVPADPCEIYSPHPGMTRALFSACPICGGLKVNT